MNRKVHSQSEPNEGMASGSRTNVDVFEQFNVNVDEVKDDEAKVEDADEDEDEDDNDFVKEEFLGDEDHTNFVKFIDDNVDAQEDAVLASIRA